MTLSYVIGISAPLADTVTTEIERRFGPVDTLTLRDRNPALHGLVADQAALRALLALLWDLNTALISVDVRVAPPGSGGPDEVQE